MSRIENILFQLKITKTNRTKPTVLRQLKKIAHAKQDFKKREKMKKQGDWLGLAKERKSASLVRVRHFCLFCGRFRGYIRNFACCRICFRENAQKGNFPGIRKSSW